jgi:starch phosphorylase
VDDPAVRHRIVFLPDYDMSMARYLYRGCDIWLNNPVRPLEACGTSGMKSALNGGLNLSIRDGWWDEHYDGSNGWAIPTADGVTDPLRRDDLEAAALYDLLGQQIAPLFYERDAAGVPGGWLSMIWHTLETLGPRVQASRMVREYVESGYVPAAQMVAAATGDDYRGARSLSEYRTKLGISWSRVKIFDSELAIEAQESMVVGTDVLVKARIDLAGLTPSDVDVQAVVGKVGDSDELHDFVTVPMDSTGIGEFTAKLQLPHAGSLGYTVRVLPRHPLLASSAELGKVVLASGQ